MNKRVKLVLSATPSHKYSKFLSSVSVQIDPLFSSFSTQNLYLNSYAKLTKLPKRKERK